MTVVFQIDDYRPHRTSPMVCRTCHERWIAVYPIGVRLPVECPRCREMAGEPVTEVPA
jgi:hypothetical protein